MIDYQEKNIELIKEYKNGNREILTDIINLNSNLIYSIINNYKSVYTNLSIDDLYQEGCLGLIRAVELYDEDKGSFSNYAIYWIKQKIFAAISSLPIHGFSTSRNLSEAYRYIKIAYEKYLNEYNKTPTFEDIYPKLPTYYNKNTFKTAWDLFGLKDFSLDEAAYEGEDIDVKEKIQIYNDYDFTEDIIINDLVKKGFNILSDKEKDIIYKKYFKNLKCSEIAKDYNCTRQWIDMIIKRACNKMYVYLEYGFIVKNPEAFIKKKRK